MKIAVTASGKSLDSQIDQRFGRCAFFIIVETDSMQFEDFSNEQAAMVGGAGIQSAQFLASQGVQAVLTGRCGPNAVGTLSAAGIDLFLDQTGTVREAVSRFKNQALQSSTAANVESHHGLEHIPFADGSPVPPVSSPTEMGDRMGQGRGMGGGMGRGRGMGGGMGQGRGMGGGRGGRCRRR